MSSLLSPFARLALLALAMPACRPSLPQSLEAQADAKKPAASLPKDPAPVPSAKVPPEQWTALAQGERSFAERLYTKLASEPGNLFFSPTSVRLALGMTYAGARNTTARQMAATLSFGDNPQLLHDAHASLLGEWQTAAHSANPEFTLRVANRLWGQTGRAFRPDFLQLVQTRYGAPLQPLDFLHDVEGSRVTINRWVAERTEEKIPELLARGILTPGTPLVLTNAVYFKANWTQAFPAAATSPQPFQLAPQRTVTVPMMQLTAKLRYAQVDAAQVLELPYGAADAEGETRLSMTVLLPDDRAGLPQLEKALAGGRLADFLSAPQPAKVQVFLPRFQARSAFKLGQTLTALGMPEAFDSKQADFSGMAALHELYIGEVIHQAYVAVDEKGTEAAAATAVVMAPGGAPPAPPQTFRADHPFLFVIRDRRRGNILFMGRIADPTQPAGK